MKTLLSYLRLFLIGNFAFWSVALSAQDIHFSQFTNSPLNLNPGLAGVYGGDGRFAANYRSQWQSVPVPYRTFSLSAEGKAYWAKDKYDRYLAGGLMVNSDEQGSLHLKSLLIGLPVSVTLPIAKRKYLTLGVMPALGQRRFETDKLSFDAQWQNRVYDPAADTREGLLFENTQLKYFDLSAGANLRLQGLGRRNRLDVGAAFHHINRPNHDFWSSQLTTTGKVRLRTKSTFYAGGMAQLQPNMDFLAHGMYQKQGAYRELVYGFALRYHLNQKPYKELAVQVGFDRRHHFNDAIIPHAEVLFRSWTLGFTYDINWFFGNSPDVRLVTSGRGGPEVALIYRFFKPKPLKVFKSCPMI